MKNVPVVLFGYETYYIYHNIGHLTSHSSVFRKLYKMCLTSCVIVRWPSTFQLMNQEKVIFLHSGKNGVQSF